MTFLAMQQLAASAAAAAGRSGGTTRCVEGFGRLRRSHTVVPSVGGRCISIGSRDARLLNSRYNRNPAAAFRRTAAGNRKVFKSTVSGDATAATTAKAAEAEAAVAAEPPTRKQLWRVFMHAYVFGRYICVEK